MSASSCLRVPGAAVRVYRMGSMMVVVLVAGLLVSCTGDPGTPPVTVEDVTNESRAQDLAGLTEDVEEVTPTGSLIGLPPTEHGTELDQFVKRSWSFIAPDETAAFSAAREVRDVASDEGWALVEEGTDAGLEGSLVISLSRQSPAGTVDMLIVAETEAWASEGSGLPGGNVRVETTLWPR